MNSEHKAPSTSSGSEEPKNIPPDDQTGRGRPVGSGLFCGFDPKTAPIWQAMNAALFGEFAGTSGERVAEWLRLDEDRKLLNLQIRSIRGLNPAPSTKEAVRGLLDWFEGAPPQENPITWGKESVQDALELSPEEQALRATVFDFYGHVKDFSERLLKETRTAILKGDEAYFQSVAGMIKRIKQLGLDRLKAAHPTHIIVSIAAEERRARDAAEGIASNGMNEPMPHDGNLTAAQLCAEVNSRLNQDQETHSEKAIRRWAAEVGYRFKQAKTGRPQGRKNALPPKKTGKRT